MAAVTVDPYCFGALPGPSSSSTPSSGVGTALVADSLFESTSGFGRAGSGSLKRSREDSDAEFPADAKRPRTVPWTSTSVEQPRSDPKSLAAPYPAEYIRVGDGPILRRDGDLSYLFMKSDECHYCARMPQHSYEALLRAPPPCDCARKEAEERKKSAEERRKWAAELLAISSGLMYDGALESQSTMQQTGESWDWLGTAAALTALPGSPGEESILIQEDEPFDLGLPLEESTFEWGESWYTEATPSPSTAPSDILPSAEVFGQPTQPEPASCTPPVKDPLDIGFSPDEPESSQPEDAASSTVSTPTDISSADDVPIHEFPVRNSSSTRRRRRRVHIENLSEEEKKLRARGGWNLGKKLLRARAEFRKISNADDIDASFRCPFPEEDRPPSRAGTPPRSINDKQLLVLPESHQYYTYYLDHAAQQRLCTPILRGDLIRGCGPAGLRWATLVRDDAARLSPDERPLRAEGAVLEHRFRFLGMEGEETLTMYADPAAVQAWRAHSEAIARIRDPSDGAVRAAGVTTSGEIVYGIVSV
ncbi:hypothetical protein C8Q76DRAFT_749956 [Earliella scabrosa]|nr:hypothetical protein C8Q76DRAFT_749956 [Earliella scabrosa]